MPFSTDSLTKARDSGYSDEEITSFVATSDPRIKSAVDSGYQLDEIASFLDSRPVIPVNPVEEPEPERPSGELGSRFLADVASSAADVATMGMRVSKNLNPLQKVGDWIVDKTGVGVKSDEIITELEGVSARARDDYGVDPKFDKRFASQLVSGAASLVPIVASGGILAPLTGAAMAGEAGRREAEEAGAPEDAQFYAGAANAAVTLVTEKLLGLPALLQSAKKLKVPHGTFRQMVTAITKQVGLGAAREGTQEALESVSNDLIATALYDFNRGVDWKKAAMSGAVGSIIGGGFGGVVQLSEQASASQNERAAEKIDSSLAQMAVAEPPPVTVETAEIPTINIPAEEATVVEPTIEFVGTSIQTPEGPITGEVQGTPHPEMIADALEKGVPFEEVEGSLGFAFRNPDGSTEWVDRVEAGRILTESGQLVGLKEGTPLTSEHIRNEVEGVTFTPQPETPNAVQVEETGTLHGNVPEQPPEVTAEVPTPQGSERVPQGAEAQTQIAEALQPFRNKAIGAAKQAGALDPESAVQEAMVDLAKRGVVLKNPEGLLIESAIRQALKQQAKEKAVKRGGGKVVSGDIETETGETVIAQAATERGPRSEQVSMEDVASIEEAAAKLPKSEAAVMREMFKDPNLTDKQLANLTGLTEGAVGMAKMRARQTLRDFIRQQGIGQKLGPGAANQREFQKARWLIAASIYHELKNTDALSRQAFEDRMHTEFEDVFTPKQIDEAFMVAQEATEQYEESGGRKPFPVILDQLMGKPVGEGETALQNSQAERERAARNLPPAKQTARKSDPELWDQAQQAMQNDPQLQAEIITRLLADPRAVLKDFELMILLDAKIDAENHYDRTIKRFNEAKTEEEKLIIKEQLVATSKTLGDLYDIAKSTGSAQGSAFRARRLLVSRDFSVGRLLSELEASKGSQLSAEDQELVQKTNKVAGDAQSALEGRIDQLENIQATQYAEDSLKSLQSSMPLDKRILDIANKLVAKLDSAADKARARMRARAGNLNLSINPADFADAVIIGASYIAKGLRSVAWKVAMRNDLNSMGVEYDESDLDRVFDEADKQLDQLESLVPEKDRKSVRTAVRKTGTRDIIKDTTGKLKDRIEDGESITKLRPYVKKIALAFVRAGVNSVEGLTDAVHGILSPMVPGLTKREAMDLWSGYGDFRALDPDADKKILRDLSAQAQNASKLIDIKAKKPLLMSGFEREKRSNATRKIIREVNEAKKKYGVVRPDPARHLASSLDSIKTGLKNELSDLTTQIETGENPLPGVPAPTDSEIEALKQLRNRVRQTLREIEGTPETTEEQRVKAAENAYERSIAELERQIKNKEFFAIPGDQPTSVKLDTLKARKAALVAELDALKEANQELQDTREFDRLMKEADKLQGMLSRGEVQPQTKAERIEDELVTQARDHVQDLRDQLRAARFATPEAEQARLEAAIKSVERSISAYDAMLKSGKVDVAQKGPKPTSPILERLRAERDVMVKLIATLRKGPPLSPEEKGIKALKARMLRETAVIKERTRVGDFERRVRKPLDLSRDPEAVRAVSERNKAMEEFRDKQQKYEEAQLSAIERTFHFIRHRADDAKSSVGSVDLSAFMKQSAPATLSHPLVAFRNLITSIQAMKESRLNEENSKLELRKNATNGIYKMSGVDFTGLSGPLSKQEESFRSTWSKKLPWVKWSERQFVTFLNLMRADLVDIMVASSPTELTPKQLKAIGRKANIATGRGDLGKYAGAADLLSVPLWSPRLYVSRLQTLVAYDVLHNDAKGVRKILIREYYRAAASGLAILLMGGLLGAQFEWDPDSSDFLKLRFGKRRIDPWGGTQQWLVFLVRMISGQYKTTKGKEFSMFRPQKRPGPYDPTYIDTAARMTRSKLNPVFGNLLNYAIGEDIQGNKVSGLQAIGGATLPLSVFQSDFVPTAKEYGIGTAANDMLLNMSGVSVQLYEDDKKVREGQR